MKKGMIHYSFIKTRLLALNKFLRSDISFYKTKILSIKVKDLLFTSKKVDKRKKTLKGNNESPDTLNNCRGS